MPDIKNSPTYNKGVIQLRNRRHANRKRAIEFLGGRCANCGTTDRLEFDHIKNDRKDDKHCIGYLVSGKWEKIEAELQKCQLLCSSCHIRKSMQDRGYQYESQHGTKSKYDKHNCRCVKCRLAMSTYYSQRYKQKRLEGAMA